jgi:hypothetical protein
MESRQSLNHARWGSKIIRHTSRSRMAYELALKFVYLCPFLDLWLMMSLRNRHVGK